MSEKTSELRDIVVIMNDALNSFRKSGDTMTETFESSSNMQEIIDGLKDAHTHHVRGMFRLGLAYEKLAKGAKIEEEKERLRQEK